VIEYKSPREIELIRAAGKIVASAHQQLQSFIQAGVSGKEIDRFVEDIIEKNGAIPSFKGYEGYPAATNVSVNEEVVHGIPGQRVLQHGDIVTVDIGACYKGFHADSGWTYAVGDVDAQKQKLMRVTEEALYKAIDIVGPGTRLRDVSRLIGTYITSNGLSIVKELAGHGLGRSLHEDPLVLNYDDGVSGDLIFKPGLVIAIEPIVTIGNPQIEVLDDGWTIVSVDGSSAAQYEHTVAITETGCDILTKL
jgi:methionyl aminopeptidase